MMKKLFILCFMATALLVLNCFAANNLYQVNLIVFTQLSNQALKSESWPNHLLKPNLSHSIDIQSPTLNAKNFSLLPKEQRGLNNEAYGLHKKSDYQILLHLSWTQPITGSKSVKWIQIFGGQAYDAKGNPINVQEDEVDQADIKPAYWQFNGKIKIYRNRFFTMKSLFYLTLPNDLFDPNTDNETMQQFQLIPLRTVTLFKTTKTRLNEINYFDHPLFGVLMQITKVKKMKEL